MTTKKVADNKKRYEKPGLEDRDLGYDYDDHEEYRTNYRKHVSTPPPEVRHNEYTYKKLYRSTQNKWIGGVCGGLAEYLNKDPVLIRLLWIVVTIISFGIGIIAYIAFWLLVDKHPSGKIHEQYYAQGRPKAIHYHYYFKANH